MSQSNLVIFQLHEVGGAHGIIGSLSSPTDLIHQELLANHIDFKDRLDGYLAGGVFTQPGLYYFAEDNGQNAWACIFQLMIDPATGKLEARTDRHQPIAQSRVTRLTSWTGVP